MAGVSFLANTNDSIHSIDELYNDDEGEQKQKNRNNNRTSTNISFGQQNIVKFTDEVDDSVSFPQIGGL